MYELCYNEYLHTQVCAVIVYEICWIGSMYNTSIFNGMEFCYLIFQSRSRILMSLMCEAAV